MPNPSSRNSDPLHRLAYLAATSVYAPLGIDLPDRIQIAYTAILTASQNGITGKNELLRRANIALVREYRLYRSFRGQRQQQPGLHPNALKYWMHGRIPFEDRVIERLAVRQVLNALPDRHRKTLTDAANGIRPKYATELQSARRAAWALWHDWETPQQHLYKTRGRTLARRAA